MYINRKYNAIITHSAEKINLRENYMAKAKKNDAGKWEVQATKTIDGKKIRKRFYGKTKKEAEGAAALWVLNSEAERSASSMTLGQAVDIYIESRSNVCSPSTIANYQKIRRCNFTELYDMRLNELTSDTLQTAVNEFSETHSAKTVHNAYNLLSAAMKKQGITHVVALPKKKKTLSKLPPIDDVINAIVGSEIECACLLAMWLSLRMSEVRGLRYDDIDGDYILIRNTRILIKGEDIFKESTKTYQSTRRLSLPSYLKNLCGAGKPEEFIVNMSANQIYYRLQDLLAEAGVPSIRFHDLRHYNASAMGELGIADVYAMERGGWDTSSIYHRTYQHTFDEYKREADAKINKYFVEKVQNRSAQKVHSFDK